MGDISDRITVYAGSRSYQQSSNTNSGPGPIGGAFTQTFLKGLKSGSPFQPAFDSTASRALVEPPYLGYGQNAQQYGPAMNRSYKKGTAVLVEGQHKNEGDAAGFGADIRAMEKKYQEMGFTTQKVRSWNEYTQALKKAREDGSKQKDNLLVVHYTGHGDIVAEKRADGSYEASKLNEEGQSAKNNPNQTGALYFLDDKAPANGEDEASYRNAVHEKDFMKPIVYASDKFDHTLVVMDSCHAGAIDNKQYTQDLLRSNPNPFVQEKKDLSLWSQR